jgi:hypothetical protein
MTPAHDFIVVGEGVYRLEVPDVGIVLHVDRLRRKAGELIGELTATCSLAGAHRLNDDDVISAADLNLSSVRARQDRASLLMKRSRFPEHDWFGSVEYFCQRIVQAERIGQPAVLLRDVPKPSPDQAWTIHGLPVLREQPMILFGDGGSGKSLLALSIAGELAQRGVPTLYADWETSEGDHRERLEQMFGSPMPGVLYVRCESPLAHEADRLRRLVLTHGLQYIILDSVAFGCEGPPEAAESASAYFRAARRLRVGTLLVAHITKSESGDQRPFGSAFWHNGARSTWFAKRSEADGNPGQMTVGLFNRKSNAGPLLSARGLRVSFGDGRISIQPADLAASEDFAAKLPLWQRMKGALDHGPLTLEALAEALGAPEDSLKKVVDRSQKRTDPMFTRVPAAGDGKTRIALVARRFA